MNKRSPFGSKGLKFFWLSEGDSNSRLFHAFISIWKIHNKISFLYNNSGEVVSDKNGMAQIALNYFSQLFLDSSTPDASYFDYIIPVVGVDDNDFLISPFSLEEFTIAIKQMHPDKSPGPDGFNPTFYQ